MSPPRSNPRACFWFQSNRDEYTLRDQLGTFYGRIQHRPSGQWKAFLADGQHRSFGQQGHARSWVYLNRSSFQPQHQRRPA